jgi:cytidylate kinase
MNACPSVAIDGPAASGKTTAARAVADRLGALYLDTGAMYRAVAVATLRAGTDPDDGSAIVALLAQAPVTVQADAAATLGYRVFSGAAEVAPAELFNPEVDAVVSVVARHAAVRDELVRTQRSIAALGPVVMAGRDIGTVVLPGAPVKVYLTASFEARAERRAAELAERGGPVERELVFAAILERDRQDGERAVGPLRPAPGATVIDSSDLSPSEVVDLIVELARRAGGA